LDRPFAVGGAQREAASRTRIKPSSSRAGFRSLKIGLRDQVAVPIRSYCGFTTLTLHADDTPVPVLDPGRGRTKTGRLWTAVRDERPFGSTAPPAAFYRYSPDRKAEHAHALLAGCRGFLHADGYAGFTDLLSTRS
jgi:hypothetical protein